MTEWHEKTDLPWMKVYMRWWSTPSHIELSHEALYVGLALMGLANERGRAEDGSGWAISPQGKPLSTRAIARFVRMPEDTVKDAIAQLVEAGTLTERDDGAVGFESLQRWQEDPSAHRQRKRRKRDSHADVTPDVTPSSRTDDKTNRGIEDKTKSEKKKVRSAPRSDPPADVVLVYPTKGKTKTWALTESQVQRWGELYSVSVLAECRKALAWLEANPTKQKTARGMPRALTAWLNRAQDSYRPNAQAPPRRETVTDRARARSQAALQRVAEEAKANESDQRRNDESVRGGTHKRSALELLAPPRGGAGGYVG